MYKLDPGAYHESFILSELIRYLMQTAFEKLTNDIFSSGRNRGRLGLADSADRLLISRRTLCQPGYEREGKQITNALCADNSLEVDANGVVCQISINVIDDLFEKLQYWESLKMKFQNAVAVVSYLVVVVTTVSE